MIMFWNLLFLGQILCKRLGLPGPELDVSLARLAKVLCRWWHFPRIDNLLVFPNPGAFAGPRTESSSASDSDICTVYEGVHYMHVCVCVCTETCIYIYHYIYQYN